MIQQMKHHKVGIGVILTAVHFSAMAQAGELAPRVALSGETECLIRLEPTLHARLAHGNTSLPADEVAFGGHDPSEDNFNFQGFELGTNIHLGESLKGFATVNIFKRDGEAFESEFEEGFLKLINLPGNFEMRGGRMLARFGDQNARHLHAWDFADASMTNVRFLGEDGFALDGGEITWLVPTPFADALSIGFGSAVAHTHEEEEAHAGGGGGHDHGEEAEMARPEKNIIVVRYQTQFGPNDFHRFQAGGSYLEGDNGFDMTTQIYGADFTYTWRQHGLEPGGKQFRWRTEWLMRDVENDEGGFDDSGFNSALLWEFIENWEAGLRYGYVEGVADPELAERHRTSLSLARKIDLGNDITGLVRLQYNHDDIRGHGGEDSIWLQFGFDWGPGEVR
ncbi:MAG: hypothetical protein KJO21_13685 [Verrucomicrobiae bacterium]|nr:hypothetical protein [Verrucomicrobiae bacterium]NNJ44370.1 hypothetical protein [Akkermansiaceae bacterium]